jgi:hypothetical protein
MSHSTQEIYESLRVSSREDANTWETLAWASWCLEREDVSDDEGEFPPWGELPESVKSLLGERLRDHMVRNP